MSRKMTEIICDGFRPISNMSDISYAMGTFSCQGWSYRTVGSPIGDDLQRFFDHLH